MEYVVLVFREFYDKGKHCNTINTSLHCWCFFFACINNSLLTSIINICNDRGTTEKQALVVFISITFLSNPS
jgi:hypothetical protein